MKHLGIAILAVVLFGCPWTVIADQFGDFWYTTDGESVTITDYRNDFAADLIVPDTIAGLPVTAIGTRAFYGSSLLNVTIPEGVVSIGDWAFAQSWLLNSVTLPDSLIIMGNRVFFNCLRLASMAIPDKVTSIGQAAFDSCRMMASLSIGDSVTNIGYAAIYACDSLTHVEVGMSVVGIESNAFLACRNLTSVSIPESVASIDPSAFFMCNNLVSFTVETENPNYMDIDGVLFSKGGRTLVRYPGGKTGIYAIPEGTEHIGASAFKLSQSPDRLLIPMSVSSIGVQAFSKCSRLTSISVDTKNVVYSDLGGVLFNKSQSSLILFPAGMSGGYVLPNSVTLIGELAFFNCYLLEKLTIPASLETVGESALSSCSSLTGVYFAGDAPIPGASLFSDSENATVYYLPGTTGWGDTFEERPAVVWNPVITDPLSASGTTGISFQITGTENIPIAVEATDDLLTGTWTILGTNTLAGGSLEFQDEDGGDFGNRVYRIAAP